MEIKFRLSDIVQRAPAPAPWAEGDNIPWDEPAFSQRMLNEHLTQDHDAASRRFEKIDRHAAWIHEAVLGGRQSSVLDLCCGPGLYAYRLGQSGHQCFGIDYSPASIAYARQQAEQAGLPCRFELADVRTAAYGSGYDLAMLIYGEFNVFRPADARLILRNTWQSLNPGGLLLLEPHTYAAVERSGKLEPTWYTSAGGLFSERPHLVLEESLWNADKQTSTTRFFVVDAATNEVDQYAITMQAYSDESYHQVLFESGFDTISIYPSLMGEPDPAQTSLQAILARKRD